MAWYHHLVGNGLWRDVLTWCVFTALTLALAGVKLLGHMRTMKRIADRLDTSTPGGLTDVVNALDEHNRLHKRED